MSASAIASPSRLATYASFIKLEHTVFSIPLVLAGLWLHSRGWPGIAPVVGILVVAAAGRAMGMGLNRIIDAAIDARNPRTQRRELPRGSMSRVEAWAIVAASGVIYFAGAAAIAPVCLRLSPIPVALFVVYPYLKRFTALAHLGLGLAWSMGPLGGWLASARSLDGIGQAKWLWLFSVCWVAGFDIIYATLDEAFDRKARLHSLPAALGSSRALGIAALLHGMALGFLIALWRGQLAGAASLAILALVAVLFIWQHSVADRNPELAFFKINGVIGFLVFLLVAAGVS